MSTIVLDASVAIKLISEEPDSEAALQRVAEATQVIAPDWMMLEAAHGLWKKVRASSLDDLAAEAGLGALELVVDETFIASALLPAALKLAFELPHAVYDCLYLALAIEQHCVLLTADQKFAAKVESTAYGDRVELLR